MRPPLRDRLLSRLIIDPSGCLLWTGALNAAGYGQIRIDGRMTPVHRVAWEVEYGPIPDGLVIDHVKARGCCHLNCANVAHLEPVTQRQNTLRGRGPTAINAAKEKCNSGHEFDLFNTYWRSDGRDCRTCMRDRLRRWRGQQAAGN